MISNAYRNFAFDTIEEIARSTSLPQVSKTFAAALNKLGFTAPGDQRAAAAEKWRRSSHSDRICA